jgi:hypothetical protein
MSQNSFKALHDAERMRKFDQTLTQARAGFDKLDTSAAEALIEEALGQVRVEGLDAGRYDAFRVQKSPNHNF